MNPGENTLLRELKDDIKDVKTDVKSIRTDISLLQIEVAALKVKSGTWGVVGFGIVLVVVLLFEFLFK